MKRINVIVKATDACNLRCKYCYNSETEYKRDVLSIERFDKLMRLLSEAYDEVELIWHGGEPLYVGLDFYRQAVEVEEKYFREKGLKTKNLIQTNGTLINKEWVKFFKDYKFYPGISLDGIHNDKYRQQTEKTLNAIELLQKAGLKVGCMAVVADEEFDVLENYKYFASKGVDVAFSPMFNEGAGKNLGGISAKYYVDQMNRLFDYWLYDKNGVGVKEFRTYVSMALGGCEKVCTNSSCLGKWLSISADGSLCNCGRYLVKEYPYGNIDDIEDISEVFRSEGFKAMLRGSIERRKKCLEKCDYFKYCEGGCPDMSLIAGDLSSPAPFNCATFIGVFMHVQAVMNQILADKVPLDALNPTVKSIAMKCLSQLDEN